MKLQVFKNGDKNYDDNDNGNVDMINETDAPLLNA